jgi:hypothetical protein
MRAPIQGSFKIIQLNNAVMNGLLVLEEPTKNVSKKHLKQLPLRRRVAQALHECGSGSFTTESVHAYMDRQLRRHNRLHTAYSVINDFYVNMIGWSLLGACLGYLSTCAAIAIEWTHWSEAGFSLFSYLSLILFLLFSVPVTMLILLDTFSIEVDFAMWRAYRLSVYGRDRIPSEVLGTVEILERHFPDAIFTVHELSREKVALDPLISITVNGHRGEVPVTRFFAVWDEPVVPGQLEDN